MDWIEAGFGWLGDTISGYWPSGSGSVLKSLLVDGIIGGVGGVLLFLPNIILLFLAIAILEDTGYMARAAFIMDGLMHRIGCTAVVSSRSSSGSAALFQLLWQHVRSRTSAIGCLLYWSCHW